MINFACGEQGSDINRPLSTETPLGIGEDWVGEWTSTKGVQGITEIMYGLPSTATGDMFMEFSVDGTNVARSIQIVVADMLTTPPRTLGVIAAYYRVRYVNGPVAQTEFHLQTIFHSQKVELTGRFDQALQGTEDVFLTRSVITGVGPDGVYNNINTTKQGDFQVAIFDPETGVPGLVTPAGAIKMSELTHLTGDAFGRGPLNSDTWVTALSGGGTVTEASGELVLNTNGGANAIAGINTLAKGRFYPGHFNTAHIAAQLSDVWASADTVAEWGAFDPTNTVDGDGIFIRYTGGEFNIVTRKAGVDTVVNEADFTGFIPAKTNLTTVYEVGFNAGTARFYQGPNVFHVESARAGPYVTTPHLRAGARLYNINGSTEAHDLRFRAIGLYRVGRPFAVPDFVFVGNVGGTLVKDTPGTIHRMIVSRSGGGASSETVEVYDGVDATGRVIAIIPLEGNTNVSFEMGTVFNDGLFLDLSSGQFDVTVLFD